MDRRLAVVSVAVTSTLSRGNCERSESSLPATAETSGYSTAGRRRSIRSSSRGSKSPGPSDSTVEGAEEQSMRNDSVTENDSATSPLSPAQEKRYALSFSPPLLPFNLLASYAATSFSNDKSNSFAI